MKRNILNLILLASMFAFIGCSKEKADIIIKNGTILTIGLYGLFGKFIKI